MSDPVIPLPFPPEAWEPAARSALLDKTTYLPAGWVAQMHLTPPDPSLLTQELQAVFDMKAERTPDKIREIELQAQSSDGVSAGMQALVGDLHRPIAHPATRALLRSSLLDLMPVIYYFKSVFNTARPWHYRADIEPMFQRPHPWYPGFPGYPSGHSTQAHTVALLYSEMFPNLKPQLLQLAAGVARNREVAGLHFESDSTAGAELAHRYVRLLLRQPAFCDLLALARAEWA